MKKLLATAGVALMMLTPTVAYAADSTTAPVTCMLDNGEVVPCVTSPVPLPSAPTYPPHPVEQKTKTKPPVEGAASEVAAIMILSFLFGAAVITLAWCSGRFDNN